MTLIVENKEKEFENPTPGNHDAVCYQIIDLGSKMTKFGVKRKIRFYFELLDQRTSEDKPMIALATYNASMHEKAGMRKFLESWRGGDFTKEEAMKFDIEKLLGQPCGVILIESKTEKGTFMNINSVFTNPKLQGKVSENSMVCWSFDNPDDNVFEKLNESLQKQLMESAEYKESIFKNDSA